MKKSDVKVGATYSAKVSGSVVPVRIDRENPSGGWDGTNLKTKKAVRIKSAQRLRGEAAKRTGKPRAKAGGAAARKGAAAPAAKKQRQPKAEKPKKERKPSGLDAAAQVLAEAGQPLSTKEMVERMLAKGLWKTKGKTPAATIYAAIIREIATKGAVARFEKVGRGKFQIRKGV